MRGFVIGSIAFFVVSVCCSVALCAVAASDGESLPQNDRRYEAIKKNFRSNIYPVFERQKWHLINYEGEKACESRYDSIKVFIHGNTYSLIAMQGNEYFAIDEKGVGKQLSIPDGFDIEEVLSCPKDFLLLRNIQKMKEYSPYRGYDVRGYDMQSNSFVTDYIGMASWSGDTICGIIPEENNSEKTQFVAYRIENGKSIVLENSNEYSRGAVIGNFIIAEKKGDGHRGRGEIFDLNFNKLLSPGRHYAFGWLPANDNKIVMVFRVPDKEPHFGFIDGISGGIIANGYKQVLPFSNSMAKVQCQDGQYGFIETNGDLAVSCQFTHASKFKFDVAFVSHAKNSKIFAIDRVGEHLFDLPFSPDQVVSLDSLISYGVALYRENTRRQSPFPPDSPPVSMQLRNLDGKVIWETTSQKDIDVMRNCPLYN